MFKVTSDLSLVLRKELSTDSTNNWVTASGIQGTWVTVASDGTATLPTAASGFAYPIWTESNRDQTVAFTKDSVNSKKVTVIVGKVFATTNKYTGSIAQGAALKVDSIGRLVDQAGSGTIVAYCVKAAYSTTYFGSSVSVIDIVTV